MKAFCRIKEKRGATCSWCGVNSFCPEKGSEGCSSDHLAPWSSELTGEGQNYRTRKTPASLINTAEQLHWLWITQVQKKSDVLGFSYYPELKCIPKRYQRAPHFHCYLWVRLQGKVTGKADCLMSTGGISSYSFYDPDGILIGTIEFEEGLLVMDDGRYYFEES